MSRWQVLPENITMLELESIPAYCTLSVSRSESRKTVRGLFLFKPVRVGLEESYLISNNPASDSGGCKPMLLKRLISDSYSIV
jgi:hypothetical protein